MAKDMRIILVPRFGVTSKDDWYEWLERKLRAKKKFPLGEWVFCDLKPKPDKPEPTACNKHLAKILGTGKTELANTLIIAHSLGAQIALRTLAAMKDGDKVGGILCVAGWLKLDHPPSTLTPWTEQSFDEKAAKAHAAKVINVISENDPNQMDTIRVSTEWRDGTLGADIILSPKPGHVSGAEEPDVFDAVLKHFG